MVPSRRSLRALILAFAGGMAFGAGAPAMPQGRYTFRSYGSDQGLKNLSPQCLVQDRQGFLWVGTEDGLYRYDGHRFQNFSVGDGLPSSFVTNLEQDRQGRLWVGTYQGLAVLEGDRFRAFGPEQGLSRDRVVDMSVGGEGQVWVGLGAGPQALGSDGKPLALPPWPGGQASALWCGSSHDHGWAARWVESGPGQGAQLLELKQGSWVAWNEPSGFGHERLDAVLQDRAGTVWVRGAHHLWARRPGEAQFREALPGIPATSVRATLRLGRDGTLYVPTYQGIRYLQRGEWKSLDAQSGLPTEWAMDVLEDSEGSLWVASTGVHRLLGRGLWRAYSQRDGLPNEVVWTILRNRDRQFFVGTDQGLATPGAKAWPLVPGTEGRAIRTVVESPDGALYMSGVPAEVLKWDPRSKRMTSRLGREAGLRGKRVFRLVLDGDGVLWAATDDAGLQKADTRAKSPRFEPVPLPGGSSTEFITGLCLGPSGRLYASGQNGLAVLDHGVWRRYTKADGLQNTHVAYSLELKGGDLLVAYFESGGFSRVRIKPGGLEVQPPPDPSGQLGREKVYMLGEDSQGRVWVGTGQGVFVIQGQDVQRFGLADGMVGEDVDNMAFLADPGGDAWVGTSAGLARFDASSYRGPAAAPATVLLSCSLGGHPQPLTDMEPKVPFRDGTLEARFAGLSFLGEGFVQHGIRLRGLEEDWHVTETQEARYPALAPRSYVLEVRSRVAQGPWGEPAVFAFEVAPAWWQSLWFKFLCLAALVGAVAGIIRWRLSALKRQAEELQELVHQRTEELEAANETLRNQSLTDPLTGLRNRRYLATRLPEDVAQVQRLHHELRRKEDQARLNKDLVFLMVDLDHFKQVNDTYGHAAGDQVLLQVSELLRLCIRESDFVVRWGGEEFLVVARHANRDEAPVMAERIRIAVGEHEFDLGEGHTIRRTCSIGFAPVPFLASEPDLLHWEQVVDLADHCLYTAKRSGRDAWVGVLATETFRRESSRDLARQIAEFVQDGSLKVETSRPKPDSLRWD